MVKFLPGYIWNQNDPRGAYTVDIKREVEIFKRKHPDVLKPVVIFDFIGTIPVLVHNSYETLCAGRHGECIRRSETLFQKFCSIGIDMVFFLDGPLKEVKIPKLLRGSNRSYEEEKKIFADLKDQQPILDRFDNFLITYYSNYLRVAKKYGQVFISFQNECDLDIAEYATRTKALAVIAHDSDFLIMPGDWPIWISRTLNVRDMTVYVWDKRKLRESLMLEQWQMPILATLSGTDWIEHKYVEHLWQPFSGTLVQVEKAFAAFIRRTFQNREDLNVKITNLIYNGGKSELSYKEIEKLVNISLNFYDYKYQKMTRPDPHWLRDHILQTACFNVYSIYYQKALNVNHRFVDISKVNEGIASFSDLVLPIIRREIGIMDINRREAYRNIKQSICLKPSESEPFCIKEYTPIHPDFEVPEMKDILSNDESSISMEKRIEILSWVVSPKSKLPVAHVVKLLKSIFIVPALIVNYLVQEHQITEDEADIFLLCIFEAFRMDPINAESLTGPETVAEHPFWLAHLYTNLIRYFEEAMIFCGLYTYVPHSYFDGYLFHKIYAKYTGMTYDEKLAKRNPISDYRLFGI